MHKGFAPVLIILVIAVLLIGAYLLGTKNANLGSFVTFTTPIATGPVACSSTAVSGYEVAKVTTSVDSKGIATMKPAQFEAKLKNDNSTQTIIIYAQTPGPGGRGLPVITKIFSGPKNCLSEEFSYTGNEDKRSGNELHNAQVFPNFWGDGRTILDVENESTGYGLGSTYFLNFISYANGKYRVINGPIVGSATKYGFKGANGVGNEILVAKPIWAPSEAHFDPHLYTFEKFIWDGQKYNEIKLGTTKNKYQPSTIDQMIQAEPSVLQP